MRKILLSVAAVAGFTGHAFTGLALASDLPSTKAPPAPVFTAAPIAFSWTGFYAGVEGGAGFAQTHGPLDVYGVGGPAPYRVGSTGGLIGGLVGYNQQFGSLVLGVEGNADGIIGGNRSITTSDALGNSYGVASTNTYDADLRGRVGFAIDRALLYAAGGVAFGNVNTSYSGAALPGAATFNSDRVGWTIGGGLDYAFTNNIVARAEYRFTDLGSSSYNNPALGFSDKTHYESNAALVGVMYKFGNP